MTANTLLDHWQTYCAGAEEASRPTPDRATWRVSRSIYIGETNEEAWDHARNGTFKDSYDYMIKVLTKANMLHVPKHNPDVSDEEVTPEYMMKHEFIIGDVDECIRQLQEVWDVTGGFGTLLMITHDWDDRAKWIRSMELLAKEVIPAMPTI